MKADPAAAAAEADAARAKIDELKNKGELTAEEEAELQRLEGKVAAYVARRAGVEEPPRHAPPTRRGCHPEVPN